jgi:hypothetical protein
MELLTKDLYVVQDARDCKSGLYSRAILQSRFELFEPVLVIFDCAVNSGSEAVFECSYP